MLDFASNKLMVDREKSPEHKLRSSRPEILRSNFTKKKRKNLYFEKMNTNY